TKGRPRVVTIKRGAAPGLLPAPRTHERDLLRAAALAAVADALVAHSRQADLLPLRGLASRLDAAALARPVQLLAGLLLRRGRPLLFFRLWLWLGLWLRFGLWLRLGHDTLAVRVA